MNSSRTGFSLSGFVLQGKKKSGRLKPVLLKGAPI
jgi:hypothetical protein